MDMRAAQLVERAQRAHSTLDAALAAQAAQTTRIADLTSKMGTVGLRLCGFLAPKQLPLAMLAANLKTCLARCVRPAAGQGPAPSHRISTCIGNVKRALCLVAVTASWSAILQV